MVLQIEKALGLLLSHGMHRVTITTQMGFVAAILEQGGIHRVLEVLLTFLRASDEDVSLRDVGLMSALSLLYLSADSRVRTWLEERKAFGTVVEATEARLKHASDEQVECVVEVLVATPTLRRLLPELMLERNFDAQRYACSRLIELSAVEKGVSALLRNVTADHSATLRRRIADKLVGLGECKWEEWITGEVTDFDRLALSQDEDAMEALRLSADAGCLGAQLALHRSKSEATASPVLLFSDDDDKAEGEHWLHACLDRDGKCGVVYHKKESAQHGRQVVFALPTGEIMWHTDAFRDGSVKLHRIERAGIGPGGENICFIVVDKEEPCDSVVWRVEADGRRQSVCSVMEFVPFRVAKRIWTSPAGRYMGFVDGWSKSDTLVVLDTWTNARVHKGDELSNAIAFSRDERFLLAGSGMTLSMFEIPTSEDRTPIGLRFLRRLFRPRTLVNRWTTRVAYDPSSVAISPDGRTALALMGSRKVRLWDIETGETLRDLAPVGKQQEDSYRVAYFANGRVAAAFRGSSRSVVLWDLTPDVVPRSTVCTSWPVGRLASRGVATVEMSTDAEGNYLLCHDSKDVVFVPTHWKALAPMFPDVASCPLCKASVPAGTKTCPGCSCSFSELHSILKRRNALKRCEASTVEPAQKPREWDPGIPQTEIYELVGVLEGAFGGGEDGYWPTDDRPRQWGPARARLAQAGPRVIPTIVQSLVRDAERYRYDKSTAFDYLFWVLQDLGPTCAPELMDAVEGFGDRIGLADTPESYVKGRVRSLVHRWEGEELAREREELARCDDTPEF